MLAHRAYQKSEGGKEAFLQPIRREGSTLLWTQSLNFPVGCWLFGFVLRTFNIVPIRDSMLNRAHH